MSATQHQVGSSSASLSSSTSSDSSVIAAHCCCLRNAGRSKEQIHIGRRAMVNKLWFHELARKWFRAKFKSPAARCFSEPKCRDRLELWYLLYRWLIFVLWLTVIVCSVFEVGSVEPLGKFDKWPIYLTNWDLGLGLLQALLGLLIVSQRWRLQRSRPDFDPASLSYGKLERLYWYLNVVTTSLALGVTAIYWTLVHNPRYHHVDAHNLMIHVGNSVLMLLDLAVAGVPFDLRSFWWCPLFVTFYIFFSLVYYAAGGLDKHGKHYIYEILDWKKPARTLLVCAGALTFLVVTHCLLCLLARVRNRIYESKQASKYSLDNQRQKQQKNELNVSV